MTDNPRAMAEEGPGSEVLLRDRPDLHREIANASGKVTGRYSLWWRNPPTFQGHRVGVIGHFAVDDRPTAQRILTQACIELSDRECSLAIGPMNGNTWRPYRLVTEFGTEPNFFLEPWNPREWIADFQAAGFSALAHYVSELNTDLGFRSVQWRRAKQHLASTSVSIRSLDMKHWERDIKEIWTVARKGFRNNLFYTDFSELEFFSQCESLRCVIEPELVLIATSKYEPIGFQFAIPEVSLIGSGDPVTTAIVKSLAVLPGRRYAGLGHLLLAQGQFIAQGLGYSRMIHALIRENSMSHRLSQQYATTFRRYAIFAKELRP